jgi:predicted SAM-dependent methyltransferase
MTQALGRRSRKIVPTGVRIAFRDLWKELKIACIVLASASKFKALRGKRGLRVHLGCGTDVKPGWINVDLTTKPPVIDKDAAPGTIFINHDLRRGLPVERGSCAIIYSSHFFEHLSYAHAVTLLHICHRALQPGGVLRAALPNFRGAFQAYLRGDAGYFDLLNTFELLPQLKPGTKTLIDYINYCVYQYGEHKWIMDEEKMLALLKHVGFNSVAISSFREDVDPASELRRRYSFYVEAIK